MKYGINISKGVLLTIVLLFLVGIAWFFYYNTDRNPEQRNDDVDTSDWITYESEEFAFSVSYPRDWVIAEFRDPRSEAIFNIYKPTDVSSQPPFIHHSSETHVSVFPEGVPTEGVSGEQKESNIDFNVDVNRAEDYVLSDGTVFATYAHVGAIAERWNESGFLFARSQIHDVKTECFRGEEQVSMEQCDVLWDDTLVRHGSIDSETRAIQEAILASFRIMDSTDEDGGGPTSHQDIIRVSSPQRSDVVSSPMRITGTARGTWYFEGDFPVRIFDANGNELGRHYATAQDDWMTEDFVPFVSQLSFDTPSNQEGVLVLSKNNPSDLREYDDEIRIPIRFLSDSVVNMRDVSLYYYDPDQDLDEQGSVQCSESGLVAVTRSIPVTQTPIQDTVKLLISGNLSSSEREQGIETEYPLSGFSLVSASLNEGVLTLRFNDPENATGGGSCRVTILWQQIKKTAEQFDVVESVRFEPETLFQP